MKFPIWFPPPTILYLVVPIFSASQDQIFGKFLDFQKILEKKLYEIDCNLIKDKLTEQIYISIVAFFDGTHQLVLHRNAECKSSAHVIAWFKKDPSAGFYDKPDVNEATLDNKSFWIWQTKPCTSTISKLLMYCKRL